MKASFVSWRAAVLWLGLWLGAGWAAPALAWKLTPEATSAERGMRAVRADWLQRLAAAGAFEGVAVVGKPVHEDITERALQCPENGLRPAGCDFDIRAELAGVRWNDDPAIRFLPGRGNYRGCKPGETVRMVTQPLCWVQVFRRAEAAARGGHRFTGANSNLLARSHFGDLQFLHAMAVADGEPPEQTRAGVLAWLEFTWRMATGEADFHAQRVVARLPIDGFSERFGSNKGWRIQDLFALGNPLVRTPESIQRIAFGSLLHVVQDSFAAGHVDRAAPVTGATCAGRADWLAPGPIREFHSYPKQDPRKHGHGDAPDALNAHLASGAPNVIEVVRTLADLWRARTPWDDARPYLECVFALAADARPASAGDVYRPDAQADRVQWGG